MKQHTLPIPRELREALEKNKDAKDAFEEMPPSHQREILAHLNSLKSPEAINKNIGKAITRILEYEEVLLVNRGIEAAMADIKSGKAKMYKLKDVLKEENKKRGL